jgi:hypothetical protein
MSGTAITILFMTPAAALVPLMAMSMLEHLLLDSRHGNHDIPLDGPAGGNLGAEWELSTAEGTAPGNEVDSQTVLATPSQAHL